jgi:outer membrane murein-binding lipoprotein Lpp
MFTKFVVSACILALLVVSASAQNPYTPPTPDPSETAKINQIWSGIQDLMNQAHAKGNPWLRMAHAKQHGCVRALIQTLPNLPSYAAQGTRSFASRERRSGPKLTKKGAELS